jgi:hypothetical protein
MTTPTTAQRISDRFSNNGANWRDLEGYSLDEVCRREHPEVSKTPDYTRYVFADRSSIVAGQAAWDVGLSPHCYCWEGGGHSEECSRRAMSAAT